MRCGILEVLWSFSACGFDSLGGSFRTPEKSFDAETHRKVSLARPLLKRLPLTGRLDRLDSFHSLNWAPGVLLACLCYIDDQGDLTKTDADDIDGSLLVNAVIHDRPASHCAEPQSPLHMILAPIRNTSDLNHIPHHPF